MTDEASGSPIGMIRFPGSNCDADCEFALKTCFNLAVQPVWHTSRELPGGVRGLILPGGFSYGDYLRGGHLACLSPVMQAVHGFVKKGGAVLGICNGFQILTESRLLPGTLLTNERGKFICRSVELSIDERGGGVFKNALPSGRTFSLPVAHGEGRYYCSPDTLKRLEDQGQVLFRYLENLNGSVGSIAGLASEDGKILGMMPHPERAVSPFSGAGQDGRLILEAFLASFM